jgi:hypothetical protein
MRRTKPIDLVLGGTAVVVLLVALTAGPVLLGTFVYDSKPEVGHKVDARMLEYNERVDCLWVLFTNNSKYTVNVEDAQLTVTRADGLDVLSDSVLVGELRPGDSVEKPFYLMNMPVQGKYDVWKLTSNSVTDVTVSPACGVFEDCIKCTRFPRDVYDGPECRKCEGGEAPAWLPCDSVCGVPENQLKQHGG